MTEREFRSEVLQSVHETATDLCSIGAIDKETMRRFDMACLTDIDEMKPAAIRRIRAASHGSARTL
jgi:putative transcriptional regulator